MNSLLIFRSAGCAIYPAGDSSEARGILSTLGSEHRIIFINEEWIEELGEQLAELKEKGIAVTGIPGVRGSKGIAAGLIERQAKRARGVELKDG